MLNILAYPGYAIFTTQDKGVDLTAKLHGGWTIDNGKKKLNEYCQQNRLPIPDIQYRPTGPDNNRSFVAEINMFIHKLHRQEFKMVYTV